MNQAALALISSTLSTFINSLGLVLFKLAHLKSEATHCLYFLTWQFLIGFLMMLVGSVICIGKTYWINYILVSLAYADIITLSSTSALTMVFNSLFSTYFLSEVFTKYDLASVVLISLGSSLCVLLSNYKPNELSAEVIFKFLFLGSCQIIHVISIDFVSFHCLLYDFLLF